VHYALRALIHDAAAHNDLDPDRISFTKTLHAARRSVRTGLSGTVNLATALHRAVSEILHPLLPQRRLRANARVVRRKMSNYNVKRAPHRDWPTPTLPGYAKHPGRPHPATEHAAGKPLIHCARGRSSRVPPPCREPDLLRTDRDLDVRLAPCRPAPWLGPRPGLP